MSEPPHTWAVCVTMAILATLALIVALHESPRLLAAIQKHGHSYRSEEP